jgi:regulator of replication initiation timing
LDSDDQEGPDVPPSRSPPGNDHSTLTLERIAIGLLTVALAGIFWWGERGNQISINTEHLGALDTSTAALRAQISDMASTDTALKSDAANTKRELADLVIAHETETANLGKVDAGLQDKLQRIIDQGTPVTRVLRGDVDRLLRDIDELHVLRDAGVRQWLEMAQRLARLEAEMEQTKDRAAKLRLDVNEHERTDLDMLRDRMNNMERAK